MLLEGRWTKGIRGITFRSRSHSLRHSRLLMGPTRERAPYMARKRPGTLVKYDAYLLIRSKLYPHYPPLSSLFLSLSLSSPCLVFVSLNRHLSNRIAACNRIPQNINSLCSSLFLSLSPFPRVLLRPLSSFRWEAIAKLPCTGCHEVS